MNAETEPEWPEWDFPFCPQPPDWSLDFDGITERFDWCRALADCPQDARWHAEGNVWIHTRMVCQALTESTAWRNLPATDRAILFAATLMHDIAKPACTKIEGERITSRGHSSHGAKMARQVFSGLLPDMLTPELFRLRQQIVGLVRHHGLPLYMIEQANPERSAIFASQTCRLDRVAMLAEADVRGRECEGQQDLLERIELFREVAAEQGCLSLPYQFPSDHSRALYFRNPEQYAGYHAYDDTGSEVVLMSGIPGAGKDRWVATHCAGWPAVSLDELRERMGVDPGEDQGRVIQAAQEQAREHLRRKENFVWNATNTTKQLREQVTGLFHQYRARVRIVYLESSPRELARRNRNRPRVVPESVIERLLSRLEVPDVTEAHQVEYAIG